MIEPADHEIVVPVVEEVATVSKREVETGRVRVRTVVEDRSAEIATRLLREDLVVERRAVERQVLSAPPVREEGDCTIISVIEERAVVETQLFVVEEVVIRRVASTDEVIVPVTLRSTRAVVEGDPDQSRS